jgi:acetylornithine deacetylase/succinyl-diaminopimelate desuccinylase-like protein
VVYLASNIGERNLRHPGALNAAADWIERELRDAGHAPVRQTFDVKGHACHNIEVTLTGNESREALVIGAHYDSALGSPGANDNGSGVAALLAIARRLKATRLNRTVHLVFFTNEEPPHFQGPDMGSVRQRNGYANAV